MARCTLKPIPLVETPRQTAAWIALALNGAGILVFGLIVLALPTPDLGYYRAIGVASVGMGAFGLLITLVPFRKRERWAWWAMCLYPLFWGAHWALSLPPGQDHVHQAVFLLLALLGLALSFTEVFAPRRA
jgi:hypothetical protein